MGVTSTRNNQTSSAVIASQAVTQNTSYLFNADFQSPTINRQVWISVQFYNGATALAATPPGQQETEVTGQWTTASLTATSPATATLVTITLNIAGTGNNEIALRRQHLCSGVAGTGDI